MLFFHSISCSLRTIFGYWKDLLSVTGKASVFSRDLFRHLQSNQRFVRHRLSLILSSRILTSSAAHTASASSAKPMMLVPAGRSMRRKSSYMSSFLWETRSHLRWSRLVLRRSPALFLPWASYPLSLVLREWRVLHAGPRRNFCPVFGTVLR